MENSNEFITELHNLLEKYNVQISIGLEGDTHCLDSWIEITHQPNPKRYVYDTILQLDNISHHDLKPHIKSTN
jgi:hypothetical protein